MNQDERLMRALDAARAPSRDAAFVLAVMERAEAERFRAASVLAILRGAGLAAAAAALATPFLSWSAANSEALQTGVLTTAGILALVGTARFMTERSGGAWGR